MRKMWPRHPACKYTAEETQYAKCNRLMGRKCAIGVLLAGAVSFFVGFRSATLRSALKCMMQMPMRPIWI